MKYRIHKLILTGTFKGMTVCIITDFKMEPGKIYPRWAYGAAFRVVSCEPLSV